MAGGCLGDPIEPRRPPDRGPARLGNAPCRYCFGAAQARAAGTAIPLLFLREGRIQERQAGLAGGGGREGGGRSVTPRPGLLLLRRRLPLNSDRQRVAGSWPWRGDLHAGTPGAPLPLPLLWPSLRHLSRPTLGGGGEGKAPLVQGAQPRLLGGPRGREGSDPTCAPWRLGGLAVRVLAFFAEKHNILCVSASAFTGAFPPGFSQCAPRLNLLPRKGVLRNMGLIRLSPTFSPRGG